MYDDIFYYGETEKQRKRRKLAEARRKGKAGEEIYKLKAQLFRGAKVERTGRGHDFKETTRDWWTGRVRTKFVEVKTGTAGLSKLQKRTKKKMKGAYEVDHEEPLVY